MKKGETITTKSSIPGRPRRKLVVTMECVEPGVMKITNAQIVKARRKITRHSVTLAGKVGDIITVNIKKGVK